ncbi:MAG: alpha/beta hydrolase [Planctomycetaceae bacterium]|nr:alpha/beta hydrolase [Planctomycetaceae bacterium]
MHRPVIVLLCGLLSMAAASPLSAREPDAVVPLWPELAPGETETSRGTALPRRESENPPATRVTGITAPTLDLFLADGDGPHSMVLIFPGGAYKYVVVDKEGSEIADWLNSLGISAAVVRYRTLAPDPKPPTWVRPLQDGQRAVRLARVHAAEWNIDSHRVGVMGFSAGGQAAAVVATRSAEPAYAAIDVTDEQSCRPDFALLMYPWNLVDFSGQLNDWVPVDANTPPTFLVHTHDDGVSSLSSVMYYAALKQAKVAGELHVFANGGHGYGMRPIENSHVDDWPQHAERWLRLQGILPTVASAAQDNE